MTQLIEMRVLIKSSKLSIKLAILEFLEKSTTCNTFWTHA